jgi:2',3'-cyclic-nucleotide 2'-phosphodiesterase
MKVLFVGDIMGSGGRDAFCRVAPRYKAEGKADLIVVNGENSAAGKGITPKICADLFAAGADIITLGDHCYDQREIMPYLDQEPRVLRPANYADGCPGRGIHTIETLKGSLTVMVLQARVFMNPVDCPFRKAEYLLKVTPRLAKAIFVEMHGEATSEKVAMGWHLDGRVSAVVGTHTHVQTADERLLPKGTAYLTDAGMTGPRDSVIGCEREPILKRFLTGLPVKMQPAETPSWVHGALVEIDNATGRALSITRVQEGPGGA